MKSDPKDRNAVASRLSADVGRTPLPAGRLALVGPVYPYRGGIAHYTTMLYRALKASCYEVLLVSLSRQYPQWLFPGASDRDPSEQAMRVDEARYWLDLVNPLTWVTTAFRLARYRPSVLIMQWWQGFWAPLWLTLGVAVKLSGHTKICIVCHNVLPHEARPWDRWLARLVLGMADRVIVQSKSEREVILSLLPDACAESVPHPLYDMWADKAVPRDEARVRLALPPTAPVLLFFGLVREYKGLRYLLQALPAVQRALGNVHLLVVGEFWHEKQAYLDQIRQLGVADRVTVVDRYVPNEEVPLYFAAADVVTLPYVHATQSGVVQLAYGFGGPVITTHVGAYRMWSAKELPGYSSAPQTQKRLRRLSSLSLQTRNGGHARCRL